MPLQTAYIVRARHAPRHSSLRHILAWVAAGLLLASCGGSDDSPRGGTVFPPVRGLVFVEYDADGRELQRSSAADEHGRFMFAKALSGRRVESTQSALRWEAATTRSSRLGGSTGVIYVTPISTLFDQLVMSGASEEEARRASVDMLQQACGEAAVSPADEAVMNGQGGLPPEKHQIALALAAYLNALRDVGIDPVTGRTFWRQEFTQSHHVLAASCEAAGQIYSKPWMDALVARVAASGLAMQGTSLAWLGEVRQSAAEQVLGLVASRLSHSRYPELAATTALGPPWAESPLAKSLDLAGRAVDARVALAAGTRAPGATADDVRYVLNRFGQVVSSIHGGTLHGDELAGIRLTNAGSVDRTMRLVLNGATLGGFGNLLNEILALPQTSPGQSLPERVWRWVVSRHRHQYPLTEGMLIHQPDLYFRSLGFGFCDDAANVMHWILSGLGYESRVWALNGHVVSEVKDGGRWVVYDADMQVFYTMRDGRKAGVQDLADDPSLVTDPVSPVLSRTNSAYSAAVAAIYASPEDNSTPAGYVAPIAKPLQPDFIIPPGGRIEIKRGASLEVQTIDPGTFERLPTLSLWLPPGYAGTVELPLVLLDVKGQGTVRLFDHDLQAGRQDVRAAIGAYYRNPPTPRTALSTIEIQQVGEGGLALEMVANPYYFERRPALEVRFLSADPQDLMVTQIERDPAR